MESRHEEAIRFKRHQADRDPCHDRRSRGLDAVSGIPERGRSIVDARHWPTDLSHHVLFHRGRVSLYQGRPQIYKTALCICVPIPFCLYLCAWERGGLEILCSFLFRRDLKSNQRDVVACLGTCYASGRKQRKDQGESQAADDHPHLPDHAPERLELYREPLHFGVRNKQRTLQAADAVDGLLRRVVCGCVFL